MRTKIIPLERDTLMRINKDKWFYFWYISLIGRLSKHSWTILLSVGSYMNIVQGGRGEASCVIKCKLCSRENSIDIQGMVFYAFLISNYSLFSNSNRSVGVFKNSGISKLDPLTFIWFNSIKFIILKFKFKLKNRSLKNQQHWTPRPLWTPFYYIYLLNPVGSFAHPN